MSTPITLKYGRSQLTLRKSDSIIGVKPRRSGVVRVERTDRPDRSAPGEQAARQRVLGGFELRNVAESEEMESTLNLLRADPGIEKGTHVFHTPHDATPIVPTGNLFVRWKPSATDLERDDALQTLGLEVVEVRNEDDAVLRVTTASPNPIKAAVSLQGSALVDVAEPELALQGKLYGFQLPSDEKLDAQWHLRNTGKNGGAKLGLRAGADARVIEAWEATGSLGRAEVIVAVIDDGFDLQHPDISGNGKVVAPWDFTRNNSDPRPGEGEPDWHGTACAGVAVGNANGSGIVGAAPGCRLLPVRWGRELNDTQIEAWFGYVRNQGAWVVSCSWGVNNPEYTLSTRMEEAIARCAREGRNGLGTVICFAAGNENRDVNSEAQHSIAGFAIHPDVIAVAASNSRDAKSNYSNFGREIWICAPSSGAGGRSITTADVRDGADANGQWQVRGYSTGDYTNTFGGTSSATPLVAGICGLLLSASPGLTARAVRELLKRTARKIGAASGYGPDGHSVEHGYGCVDAAAAIRTLLASAAPAPQPLPAWGEKGHHTTNRRAILGLAEPLRGVFDLHADYIENEAMAADRIKSRDPKERPRHFLDADEYGEYPFAELPEDYAAAVAKFTEPVVIKRGLLPWALADRFERLVTSFKKGQLDQAMQDAAWLGHYVGDSHVPLHTTSNHDGQLTGQPKLHGYFESTLLESIDATTIAPGEAEVLAGPIVRHAFRWIRESHLHIPTILQADRTARSPAGKRDKHAFAKLVRPIAIDRLQRGATRLASLWLTAWERAGKPQSILTASAAKFGRLVPGEALVGVVQAVAGVQTAKPASAKSSRPKRKA